MMEEQVEEEEVSKEERKRKTGRRTRSKNEDEDENENDLEEKEKEKEKEKILPQENRYTDRVAQQIQRVVLQLQNRRVCTKSHQRNLQVL
jgi:hypothetical protein